MTMTEERMALLELIEKRADGDMVRELLAYAAERLMAVEVEGLCGAKHGESAALPAPTSATGTVSGRGTPGPGGSS
jgi:putative transposase